MVSTETRKNLVLGITIFLITVIILIAGLWPFNVNPVNRVEWLQNGNGIRFYGQSMVVGQEPLVIRKAASGSGSISIELLVRPHKESSNTVASLFTLYVHNRDQFMLGQWKTHLLIRITAPPSGSRKSYREIGVANALTTGITHLITIASGKESTDIYLDGKLTENLSNFSLIPHDRGLSGRLILGNSPEGTHSWNGAFLGLAIYDRTLDGKEALDHHHSWQQHISSRPWRLSGSSMPIALYLFDEHGGEWIRDHSGARNDLLIPATFHPLRRTTLGVPAKDQWFSRSNLKDITINILGFVPFGFFVSAWLRQVKNLPPSRVYGISMLLGFCFSLAIELTQVYLPTRDSSLMDVFSNTLGAATGVFLFKYTLPVLHKTRGGRMLLS